MVPSPRWSELNISCMGPADMMFLSSEAFGQCAVVCGDEPLNNFHFQEDWDCLYVLPVAMLSPLTTVLALCCIFHIVCFSGYQPVQLHSGMVFRWVTATDTHTHTHFPPAVATVWFLLLSFGSSDQTHSSISSFPSGSSRSDSLNFCYRYISSLHFKFFSPFFQPCSCFVSWFSQKLRVMVL